MKTRIRYQSKYFCEFKNILVQHIQDNLKDYLVLTIVFIIGVFLGVIMINNSDEQSKLEISGYINSFVDLIKSDGFQVDKFQLAKVSMLENLKTVVLIWIAGSTIIGIPLIYIIIGYKGFCIGYTISAIMCSLGAGKRNCIFTCLFIFTKRYCNSNNFNAKC